MAARRTSRGMDTKERKYGARYIRDGKQEKSQKQAGLSFHKWQSYSFLLSALHTQKG